MTLPRLDHFINGAMVAPDSNEYLPVQNPASGETIAELARGNAGDVDLAVAAASAAFASPEWRDMKQAERSNLLYEIGHRIQANAQELLYLETLSSGGTVSRIAGLDIPASVDLCNTMAETVKAYPLIENLPSRPLPEATHTQVIKEPVGVCGMISAWNFPLALVMFKLVPALGAGCTAVIKPSELTPHTLMRLAELTADLLPPGVLNVVNGYGPEVGEPMSLHPGIDKIAFTGSTAVGQRIQANAATTLKRVTLELGGKSPAIVTADADLDLVAYGSLFGVMLNSGQACESGTRLLVHDSIHDQVVERLVAVAAQLKLGDPMDPNTSMGPMSSIAHGEKVMRYIESAQEQGARIACGGERVTVPGCEGGFFVSPTVICNASNDMTAVREEIFGPVIAVLRYRDIDEAVAIANDTNYGLAAGVWTGDVVAAQHLARRLRAGSVWINDWHMIRTDAPFGGFGHSGVGRELGRSGLEAYLEAKTVSTAFQRLPQSKAHYAMVHKQSA